MLEKQLGMKCVEVTGIRSHAKSKREFVVLIIIIFVALEISHAVIY